MASQITKHNSEIPQVFRHIRGSVKFLIGVASVSLILGVSGRILSMDRWVSGQSLWLISRASALIAYAVLTAIVVLGIMISHPRNKDTWRLGRHLLPWHQTLLPFFFGLIAIHVGLTGLDHKSGLTWSQLPLPIYAKYHPVAMTFGTLALYLLILVSVTAGLRRFTRVWLPIHRIAWVTWAMTTIHGFFGGSDTSQFLSLYASCAALVVSMFYWRHWTQNARLKRSA